MPWKHSLLWAATYALKRAAKAALTRGPQQLAVIVQALSAWASPPTDPDEATYRLRAVRELEWCDPVGKPDSDSGGPSTQQLVARRLCVFCVRIALEIQYTDDLNRKKECAEILSKIALYIQESSTDAQALGELLRRSFPESHDATALSETIVSWPAASRSCATHPRAHIDPAHVLSTTPRPKQKHTKMDPSEYTVSLTDLGADERGFLDVALFPLDYDVDDAGDAEVAQLAGPAQSEKQDVISPCVAARIQGHSSPLVTDPATRSSPADKRVRDELREPTESPALKRSSPATAYDSAHEAVSEDESEDESDEDEEVAEEAEVGVDAGEEEEEADGGDEVGEEVASSGGSEEESSGGSSDETEYHDDDGDVSGEDRSSGTASPGALGVLAEAGSNSSYQVPVSVVQPSDLKNLDCTSLDLPSISVLHRFLCRAWTCMLETHDGRSTHVPISRSWWDSLHAYTKGHRTFDYDRPVGQKRYASNINDPAQKNSAVDVCGGLDGGTTHIQISNLEGPLIDPSSNRQKYREHMTEVIAHMAERGAFEGVSPGTEASKLPRAAYVEPSCWTLFFALNLPEGISLNLDIVRRRLGDPGAVIHCMDKDHTVHNTKRAMTIENAQNSGLKVRVYANGTFLFNPVRAFQGVGNRYSNYDRVIQRARDSALHIVAQIANSWRGCVLQQYTTHGAEVTVYPGGGVSLVHQRMNTEQYFKCRETFRKRFRDKSAKFEAEVYEVPCDVRGVDWLCEGVQEIVGTGWNNSLSRQ